MAGGGSAKSGLMSLMKDLLGFLPLLFIQCGGINSVEFCDVEVILTVILPARASISV